MRVKQIVISALLALSLGGVAAAVATSGGGGSPANVAAVSTSGVGGSFIHPAGTYHIE
jgi:hypothetical protein